MEISDDEVSVSLSVAGYEFPDIDKKPGTDWHDLNWLRIRGSVHATDHSWAFTDPCLLTSEARGLVGWLEEAAQDRVHPVPEDQLHRAWDRDDHEEVLTFLEPNLAFSVEEHDGILVVVRVHLAHEAADPRLHGDDRLAEPSPFVRVRTTREGLMAAAQEWRTELQTWPVRDTSGH